MKPYKPAFATEPEMMPVRVYIDGYPVDGEEYDTDLWVERGEDWYAFMSPQLRGKRVRVITREDWLQYRKK